MSLEALFNPRGVAVVGASRSRDAIGGQILHNLVTAELRGVVYPVNPHAAEVQLVRAYASLRAVPDAVDLAVIAVPRSEVMGALEDCGAKGVRCAIVITAGYAELGEAGIAAQNALRDRARELGIRLVGPNCLGALNTDPEVRLNATFGQSWPPAGHISFCSQSGALGLAVLDYARELGLGIRQFVSVGNKVDVSTNDLLEHWERDDETRVILLYVESFGNPARFIDIARRVSRTKPILALKSGRGARALAQRSPTRAPWQPPMPASTRSSRKPAWCAWRRWRSSSTARDCSRASRSSQGGASASSPTPADRRSSRRTRSRNAGSSFPRSPAQPRRPCARRSYPKPPSETPST